MFENISKRFTAVFDSLRRTGILRADDVENIIREIRIVLLEADVSLPIVKEFINELKQQAIGQQIIKSITPDQMIIKIVNDQLISLMSANERNVFEKSLPKRIMMVGLQGSGKTTTAAKLANMLVQEKQAKIMMASCDIYRPAAIEQLRVLSEKVGTAFFFSGANDSAIDVVAKALEAFKISDCRSLILDTAGRLHSDTDMMTELVEIQKIFNPDEIFLVVDAMTGQDAVNVAKQFSDSVNITGIIMTRMDADAKGGAIVSVSRITNSPVVFLGTGEKLDAIERFDARRIAKRILGMGDIVSLVEQAEKVIDKNETQHSIDRLAQGKFDLNDLAKQMRMLNKIGGISSVLGMLPGIGSLIEKAKDRGGDDASVKRQLAIICSMTKQERRDYKIIKGSRKKRIATGSGTTVQEVNRLIKNFELMLGFIKQFKNNRATQNQIQQLFAGKIF